MLLRMVGWLGLAVLCGLLAAAPAGANADSHNIPEHLMECYQDKSLYDRENRLPATMPVLVSLLSQVEESPGFTMDARSFVLSLLHMFRLDGVETVPGVEWSDRSIPFSFTGQQYYRQRILMKSLIPRSSFLFPNDTLTDIEKCSLHFMMSNSLDKMERGDEHVTCKVTNYRAAPNARRQRRDVAADAGADSPDAVDTADTAAADDDVDIHSMDGDHDADDDVEAVPLDGEGGAAPAAAAAPADSQDNHSAPVAEPQADPDAEMVAGSNVAPTQGAKKGNLMWDADGKGPTMRGQLQQGPAARQQMPESDCPVENGVVYTRWGSVQLGTLLAGIATGFETQTVTIKDIRSVSRAITGLSDSLEIDNRYAATLAGDLAEVALWRGPQNKIKVGSSGNWNNTRLPRWYFTSEANEMTDAEIRGGLDGLIMAHHVREWDSKGNGPKLSQILERYYSVKGIFDYRACERQNHYKDVAPSDVLNAQTTSFAYSLYDATPSVAAITSNGLSDYASEAVEALDVTVRASSQQTSCEATPRTSDDARPDPKINLVFVVDCKWDYDVFIPAFQQLAESIELHPARSKVTVYGAANHEMIFNTTNRLHKLSIATKENKTVYEQCKKGAISMKTLLDVHLRDIFSEQLENEKDDKEAEAHSNVVVIMPDPSYELSGQELREVEKLMDHYTEYFPDVKFILFVSQNKESYKIMVENDQTDIIVFNYNYQTDIDTTELAERLKTVPRRLVNPTCGNQWKPARYDTARVYETIQSDGIAYYRIHPKYLFGIESETIKIKEQGQGTVNVCYSRTNELPGESDSDEDNDSTCESVSGKEVEIKLKNPCGSQASFRSCKPLYISVEVTESDGKCNDYACRGIDDVAVEFQHSRLTCGAASLTSPLTLAIAVVLTISKVLFSS